MEFLRGYKCFPIVEIFDSYKKSGSLNPVVLSEFWLEARKLLILCMCSKNMVENQLKLCEIDNVSIHLWLIRINIAENDDDKRFRTGSTNNVVSAHAQRKVTKNGCKCFAIMKIFDSYRKLGGGG